MHFRIFHLMLSPILYASLSYKNYGMKLEHMDETLMVQLKEQHSNYGARGVKNLVREALTTATI